MVAPCPWISSTKEVGSHYGGHSLTDDDASGFRERLLVFRAIEKLRRANWHPRREQAAKRRTRKGYRGFSAHGQGRTADEAFTAKDGREGRGARPQPEAAN